MTCIVGLSDNGKVYMYGDSLSTAGGVSRTKPGKVKKSNGIVYGGAGSVRGLQIMNRFMNDVKISEAPDLFEVDDVIVQPLRQAFKDAGNMEITNSKEEMSCAYLMGIADTLYTIYTDFSIEVYSCKYNATGSGEEFALGSLYSTTNLLPERRAILAVEAAAQFCSTVGGPITGYST